MNRVLKIRLLIIWSFVAAVFFGCERDWGSVEIASDGEFYTVTLENSYLRATYGRAKDGKDKMTELYCKIKQRKVGEFDSRHHPRDPYFHTLKSAKVLNQETGSKTVQLDYGTRVEEVTIFRDSPFLLMEYKLGDDYGHTYDRAGSGGDFVIYGAADWLQTRQALPETTIDRSTKGYMNRTELYPLYKNSFYRPEWAPPTPLSYHGWMILGVDQGGGKGFGILLPAKKIKWLKLMGNSGGFERAMNQSYRAYYFTVNSGGATALLAMAKEFIDENLKPDSTIQ